MHVIMIEYVWLHNYVYDYTQRHGKMQLQRAHSTWIDWKNVTVVMFVGSFIQLSELELNFEYSLTYEHVDNLHIWFA